MPLTCVVTTGITPNRTIAGTYIDTNNVYHGYIRTPDGGITTFDAPSAGTDAYQGTICGSINKEGEITGQYIDTDNVVHAFLRTRDGVLTTYDVP